MLGWLQNPIELISIFYLSRQTSIHDTKFSCLCSFPNDIYDRHWFSFSALNAPNTPITSPQNVSVTQPLSRDEAPVEVMNTALSLQKDSPVTLPLGVTGGSNYVVLLWLAEIDTQALTSTREFEVGIDGNWQQPIEILDKTGRQLYQAYEWGFPSVNLADTSSIDFRATNRSILGPLINGMEVFAVSDPVQPRTDVGDGNILDLYRCCNHRELVIVDINESFMLDRWRCSVL